MDRNATAWGIAAALAGIPAVAWACRLLGANELAAAFVLVVAVLAVAARFGSWPGVVASLLATTAFNVGFLPPIGTLHLDDPRNWIALACFLAATLVASRLLAAARGRAEEAEARTREIETLYRLSLELFTASTGRQAIEETMRRALAAIGAPEDALRLVDGEASPPPGTNRIPLLLAGDVAGTLVVADREPRALLGSIARLVALALEREAFLQERARLLGVEASESMKTAILRAVSHDLATPLAGMALSLDALRRGTPAGGEAAAALDRLSLDLARLHRRIHNLLAMARLEAGIAAPRREPTPPADLVRSVRESLGALVSGQRIAVHVDPSCPDLDVDPSLALEILVNLVENAHRASPTGTIEIDAGAIGDRLVRIDVLDRGPGVGDDAARPRGLGLAIARSFADAHDGTFELRAREGGGACARVELPAVARA